MRSPACLIRRVVMVFSLWDAATQGDTAALATALRHRGGVSSGVSSAAANTPPGALETTIATQSPDPEWRLGRPS